MFQGKGILCFFMFSFIQEISSIRSSLKRPIQSMGPLETPGAGHTRIAPELPVMQRERRARRGMPPPGPAWPHVTCFPPPSRRRVAHAGACGARPGRGPPEARAEPGAAPPGVAQPKRRRSGPAAPKPHTERRPVAPRTPLGRRSPVPPAGPGPGPGRGSAASGAALPERPRTRGPARPPGGPRLPTAARGGQEGPT